MNKKIKNISLNALTVLLQIITIYITYFLIDFIWSWLYEKSFLWAVLIFFLFGGILAFISISLIIAVSRLAINKLASIIPVVITSIYYAIIYIHYAWSIDYDNKSIYTNLIGTSFFVGLTLMMISSSNHKDY